MVPTAKVYLFSLKKHVFLLIILFALTACSFAQKQKNLNTDNQPQVHINVNKQLDENGNVIRYDSTYSWSWSNIDENMSDSILSQFFSKPNFMWDNTFSAFDNDSLFFNHFTLPLLNDPIFDFDFDIDKEIEQFLNKQKLWMQEQHKIIDQLKRQSQQPFHNKVPKIKDNDSPKKNNDLQKQGVDI
ncbi:MAG: hypothetical protein ACUVQP_09300 [Bacteroidales bacterium]